MLLNNRHGSVDSDAYRYGFMGEERDDEVKGEGNHIAYAERGYDPRVGRWISVDAYAPVFAGHSPYNYALNNPIYLTDSEGNWPKPSDYMSADTSPLLRGIADGVWEGLTGTFGFAYDYFSDPEFRAQTNEAFLKIINDPMGALQSIVTEYAGKIERLSTGNGTDDDFYDLGMQIGEKGAGLLLGGTTLAVSLGKQFLKKSISKGKKFDAPDTKKLNIEKEAPEITTVKQKKSQFDYTSGFDSQGRLRKVGGSLELSDLDRLRHKSKTPGKLKGDHAGHMIADRFGGSPDLDNIVSQAANLNLSGWKKMEILWANALKKGKKVDVDIKINYDGDNLRPKSFDVRYIIDGEAVLQTFNN